MTPLDQKYFTVMGFQHVHVDYCCGAVDWTFCGHCRETEGNIGTRAFLDAYQPYERERLARTLVNRTVMQHQMFVYSDSSACLEVRLTLFVCFVRLI